MKKETLREIVFLTLFAIGFGIVEAAVVHYLRLHFYPAGFNLEMNELAKTPVIFVELIREAATLLMLVSVAALTRPPFIRRFANFVLAFAVWDIVYYIALYGIEKWPASILGWDILFLIPMPWYSPVLAPIVISLTGIIGAITVHIIFDKKNEFRLKTTEAVLLILGLIIFLISVLIPSPLKGTPEYSWVLFTVSELLIFAAYFLSIRNNLKNQS